MSTIGSQVAFMALKTGAAVLETGEAIKKKSHEVVETLQTSIRNVLPAKALTSAQLHPHFGQTALSELMVDKMSSVPLTSAQLHPHFGQTALSELMVDKMSSVPLTSAQLHPLFGQPVTAAVESKGTGSLKIVSNFFSREVRNMTTQKALIGSLVIAALGITIYEVKEMWNRKVSKSAT